ncbi:MAG: hypothetical protein KJ709_06155 [Nanoarchaeota archaeon]|nr:hypothetical protein [Nanoarchaeota archaeon]
MGFSTWMDGKIKKMRWFDVSLVKLGTAAIILMIAKLWAPLLSLDWYWYLILFIVFAIKPCMIVFSK